MNIYSKQLKKYLSLLFLFIVFSTNLSAVDFTIDRMMVEDPLTTKESLEMERKALYQNRTLTSEKFVFSPVSFDETKCEIDLKGNAKILQEKIKKFVDNAINDLRGNAKQFWEAEKRKAIMNSLVKVPAIIEYYTIKGDSGYFTQVAQEVSLCTSSATQKALTTDTGGGGGDQGGTMKMGFKAKELASIVGCYNDVLYPSSMTADEQKLMLRLEAKWKKIINLLLNSTMRLTLKGLKGTPKNICNATSKQAKKDIGLLLDREGQLVLLNNESVYGEYHIGLNTNEKKLEDKNADDYKIVETIQNLSVEKDKINTNPMFTDIEPQNYKIFLNEIVAYVKKSSIAGETTGINTNYLTSFFLNKFYVDYLTQDTFIFEEEYSIIYNRLKSKNLEENNFYLLFLKMNINYDRLVEAFYDNIKLDKYDVSDIEKKMNVPVGFYNTKAEIIKALDKNKIKYILGQMYINLYSKMQYLKDKKYKIYYSNILEMLKVNNKKLNLILYMDRMNYQSNIMLEDGFNKMLLLNKEEEKLENIYTFCAHLSDQELKKFNRVCQE